MPRFHTPNKYITGFSEASSESLQKRRQSAISLKWKAFFPEDLKEGNKSLIGLYKALLERGYEVEETLPISKDRPYVFTTDDPSELISSHSVFSTQQAGFHFLFTLYRG